MVETELSTVLADEVEDRQNRLVPCPPQPAPELLQEQGRALGRPQQQDGVDVGQVEPLVEQVRREESVDLASRSACQGGARSAAGVDPLTASAGIPASRKTWAM